jgi:hypothetical protein
MKTKTTITTIAITVLLLAAACGGGAAANNEAAKTSEQSVASTNNWEDVDLSASKLKWALIAKAPKGYTLDETVDGEVSIMGEGANYRISEWPYGDKMEQVEGFKKDIKSADAFKFESFVLEKPDAFIAKTSMGYVVMRIVKVGDKFYDCDVIPLNALATEAEAKNVFDMMGLLKAK